ncbi:DNA polymerase III subunit chi [Hirschia maritima]|uniref:DNA polymerase III subunit chi n=1 Tax=Hirschia maritima TaxID=1121961 RepID=UPI00035E17F0|nr:DNA polymerase III subunit chi [Hirschia maritima]
MADTNSNKGEWWFYHLERTSLEEALGPLLEKCLQKEWRVLIVGDEDRIPRLDLGLWTWKADSFLPHARIGGRDKAEPSVQPILLSTEPDPQNSADIIVLLDGCRLPEEPNDAIKYVRCMVVFDGDDYTARDTARTQFKAAKDAGQTVSYFQQNDRGGWDKKG